MWFTGTWSFSSQIFQHALQVWHVSPFIDAGAKLSPLIFCPTLIFVSKDPHTWRQPRWPSKFGPTDTVYRGPHTPLIFVKMCLFLRWISKIQSSDKWVTAVPLPWMLDIPQGGFCPTFKSIFFRIRRYIPGPCDPFWWVLGHLLTTTGTLSLFHAFRHPRSQVIPWFVSTRGWSFELFGQAWICLGVFIYYSYCMARALWKKQSHLASCPLQSWNFTTVLTEGGWEDDNEK